MGRLATAAAGAALAVVVVLPASAHAAPDPTVPAARDAEPVVLKGKRLGSWAARANQTVKLPLMDFVAPDEDPHNHYSEPEVDTKDALGTGTPVDRILAYRWHAKSRKFHQIPVQVDEVFTRYLDNTASGFAIYSGQDKHTTYAYDREGFRFTKDGPASDPCRAQAASPPAKDPVAGLDGNDEVAFMASDAGEKAPADAELPKGIVDMKTIKVSDPVGGFKGYVYLARRGDKGPDPAFDASNGYVRYERDANADLFAFSQSSYSDYGNAAVGAYCDADGNVIGSGRRRPRDGAWITTSRYKYRYDGRWLMTQIRISPDGGQTYGPDMVDRWKARAFAQDPSSETPCCGYEEEENNWGGSSTLLGERVGPVRAIRETWGADSGTNVIRREAFYRDQMIQRTWLRVHVIPPLDGIYAQWDFNAASVDRFYNASKPEGVVVDGRNDDMGNLDDPCNPRWDANDTHELDQTYRQIYKTLGACDLTEYHQSIDPGDLTFGDANAALSWSVTTGAGGTIVDRITTALDEVTPGGAAQSLLALPYYRDDACFDDGTGSDPGPHLKARSGNEPALSPTTGAPRRCWASADGDPAGSDAYYQGSIGTHGLHLMTQVDSDNARLTVPVNEIVSDWALVMLPGRRDGKAGEQYGRSFEKPLLVRVTG